MTDAPLILQFTSLITPQSTTALISELVAANANRVSEVHLLLSSPGGDVVPGMHAYNIITNLPIKVTTYNVGNVDSMANVLFLCGSERYSCASSTFMFHSVGINVTGAYRLEERNLREHLDNIVADNRRIAAIISARTNLSIGRAAALFRQQRIRDANWALKCGFINKIKDPTIPAGATIKQVG